MLDRIGDCLKHVVTPGVHTDEHTAIRSAQGMASAHHDIVLKGMPVHPWSDPNDHHDR